MTSPDSLFGPRASAADIEDGDIFAPRFDGEGLIPVVTTDATSGELLMHAYMDAEALRRTVETGEAWYWSRSRAELWHKGESSGQIQKVIEMRTDCDQDTIWLKVEVGGNGGACHVGYRSCFYRSVETDGARPLKLRFEEKQKL